MVTLHAHCVQLVYALRFPLKIQPPEQCLKPRGRVVLPDIGLVRHGVDLGISPALVDIPFVVREQRLKSLGRLGLSRSVDDGNSLVVKLGDLLIAVCAQHCAR